MITHLYKISSNPIVVYIPSFYIFDIKYKNSFVESISMLKDKKANFIVGLNWHIGYDENYYTNILKEYESSNHLWTWWVLCNDFRECKLFDKLHIRNILINNNIFVDYNKYKPNEVIKIKKYNAVFDNEFNVNSKYELCAFLDTIMFVDRSKNPDMNFIESDIVKKNNNEIIIIETEIKNNNTDIDYLINQIYNLSGVGLSLSEYTLSPGRYIQYLLSGIPVVTTFNYGGLDYFSDGRYILHVESEPFAVSNAVQSLNNIKINAQEIRENIIEKINYERKKFISFIEEDIGLSNINYKIFDINPIQSIQITDFIDGINYES
jgi:hypothetical protein